MINIDGSQGEGGGQVLRTSLALSIVTGKPFRIFNIRAGRKNPGLQRQHLMAVKAAAEISESHTSGAKLDSRILEFRPGTARAAVYRFDVMSAGSTTLVLQTILPPLLKLDSTSTVFVEGGTHNPSAPPFEFFSLTFAPLLESMNAKVTTRLLRAGFFPGGGGRLEMSVASWQQPRPLNLEKNQMEPKWSAQALICGLDDHVGARELDVAGKALSIAPGRMKLVRVEGMGKGNALIISADCGNHLQVFTAFGWRGKRAEVVAREACDEAQAWLDSGAPVGEHLADQLLLPMVLGAGGSFVTGPISGHTETNIATIKLFLDVKIEIERLEGRRNRIVVTL